MRQIVHGETTSHIIGAAFEFNALGGFQAKGRLRSLIKRGASVLTKVLSNLPDL